MLTRDTRLVKRRAVKKFLLLHENDTFEQLKKVLETFNLDPYNMHRELFYSRCSLCNTLLENITKEQVKQHVPAYVYEMCERFKQCPKCAKFYWRGTHPERLMAKLREVISE